MRILRQNSVRVITAGLVAGIVISVIGWGVLSGRPSERQGMDPAAAETGLAPTASSGGAREEPISRDRFHRAIDLAADYLTGACGRDGRFAYHVSLDPDALECQSYNIVRHAGTIYALGMHYAWRPTDAVRETMVRAAGYLKHEAMGPVPGRNDLLAVWECPDVDDFSVPIRTTLGACGVGLLALVSTERAAPGTTPIAELRRLASFVVSLQNNDGRFCHSYLPSLGGQSDGRECLYYPGEAALGLLGLYEFDPDPLWLETAAKALGWLARSREKATVVPPDHWALLATAGLLPHCQRCSTVVTREQLLRHAVQICQNILDEQTQSLQPSADPECMTGDNRTCPTATRLEGLLAVYPFLGSEPEGFRTRMAVAMSGGIDFLVRSQFSDGPLAGGIPGVSRPLAKDHPDYSEAFNAETAEVRIDYVQHAMCAMVHCDRVLPEDRGVK
ncbi:MAG: hypothetical protein HUU20_03500 [Pirellulales bacterium]|nr:hypothetical protein [Pirellulales bacterium]